MRCLNPVSLKNGLVVPCGKCLLCLSARRDEWSVRLQLHTMQSDVRPFFVTLTYDPDNVVYGQDRFTLVRSHLTGFIKRLKDKFGLYNTDFDFFGCGEYGDQLKRPHGHFILFGFKQLEEAFNRDWLEAHDLIRDSWKLGNVDVGIAEYSGIHYVTKYVLKYDKGLDYTGIEKPFMVYSNGLGLPWLDSSEAQFLKSRLNLFKLREVEYPQLDFSDDPRETLQNFVDAYKSLLLKFPTFTCTLPSGRKAPIPRYLKRKLLGSFEHFKDNPLWIMNHISQVIRSTEYILTYGDYDRESLMSYSDQLAQFAERKIKTRLIQNNHYL